MGYGLWVVLLHIPKSADVNESSDYVTDRWMSGCEFINRLATKFEFECVSDSAGWKLRGGWVMEVFMGIF